MVSVNTLLTPPSAVKPYDSCTDIKLAVVCNNQSQSSEQLPGNPLMGNIAYEHINRMCVLFFVCFVQVSVT